MNAKEFYVLIDYEDGTQRVVRTTFDVDILKSYGVVSLESNIFDLDSKVLVPLEGNYQRYEERPEVNELSGFLRRFL